MLLLARWSGVATSVLTLSLAWLHAQPQGPSQVFPKALLTYPTPIDPDDIGGIVTSRQGPEAGVWVIAETNDLPAKLVRIVVTDDEGRYVLPDLPKASYQVFVRGYGLIDSKRTRAWPGQELYFGVLAVSTPPDTAKPRPAGPERNLVITMWDGDGTLNGQNGSPRDTPTAQTSTRGNWTTIRVPYPAEFTARVVQERVDDEQAGWKGRSVWATSPDKLLKVQVRPHPLAR